MIIASENDNLPFIVKMSSNENKMQKQCKAFSVDEKMQILAEVDAHVGTQVDLVAVLGLSVSALNKIVSKRSEVEKSYSHFGPLFYKEPKSLKTWPLEELETILLAWVKQPIMPTHQSMDPS
jgi:molybdopterin-guanine dinucleotide biosynthesis protein